MATPKPYRQRLSDDPRPPPAPRRVRVGPASITPAAAAAAAAAPPKELATVMGALDKLGPVLESFSARLERIERAMEHADRPPEGDHG